jgi:hypothetical protein
MAMFGGLTDPARSGAPRPGEPAVPVLLAGGGPPAPGPAGTYLRLQSRCSTEAIAAKRSRRWPRCSDGLGPQPGIAAELNNGD